MNVFDDQALKMMKISRKEDHVKWIDQDLHQQLPHQKHLHLQAQRTGSQEDWDTYKRYRNVLRWKKRRAKDN